MTGPHIAPVAVLAAAPAAAAGDPAEGTAQDPAAALVIDAAVLAYDGHEPEVAIVPLVSPALGTYGIAVVAGF